MPNQRVESRAEESVEATEGRTDPFQERVREAIKGVKKDGFWLLAETSYWVSQLTIFELEEGLTFEQQLQHGAGLWQLGAKRKRRWNPKKGRDEYFIPKKVKAAFTLKVQELRQKGVILSFEEVEELALYIASGKNLEPRPERTGEVHRWLLERHRKEGVEEGNKNG